MERAPDALLTFSQQFLTASTISMDFINQI